MPFCPRCHSEYREGFERCADCGAALVTELQPHSVAPPSQATREVRLAIYPTWSEASMWAERLEAESVPTVLVPLGPGAGGWGSSALLPHELRVREEDLERASALLSEGAT
jgi:hypothetical protein